MHERIRQRVSELRKDFEAGEARLAALDREAVQLRQTLLRISGAIQVLEETLAADEADPSPAARAAAE
jgi:hypothetical protein